MKVLEKGRGEDLFLARNETNMDFSSLKPARVVHGLTIDDDGANHRGELLDDEGRSSNEDAKPVFVCTVHKKFACIRHTMPGTRKLDTKLIRLAWSIQNEPGGTALVRKAMKGDHRRAACHGAWWTYFR